MQIRLVEAKYDHGLPFAEAQALLETNQAMVDRFGTRCPEKPGFYMSKHYGKHGTRNGKKEKFETPPGWSDDVEHACVPRVRICTLAPSCYSALLTVAGARSQSLAALPGPYVLQVRLVTLQTSGMGAGGAKRDKMLLLRQPGDGKAVPEGLSKFRQKWQECQPGVEEELWKYWFACAPPLLPRTRLSVASPNTLLTVLSMSLSEDCVPAGRGERRQSRESVTPASMMQVDREPLRVPRRETLQCARPRGVRARPPQARARRAARHAPARVAAARRRVLPPAAAAAAARPQTGRSRGTSHRQQGATVPHAARQAAAGRRLVCHGHGRPIGRRQHHPSTPLPAPDAVG